MSQAKRHKPSNMLLLNQPYPRMNILKSDLTPSFVSYLNKQEQGRLACLSKESAFCMHRMPFTSAVSIDCNNLSALCSSRPKVHDLTLTCSCVPRCFNQHMTVLLSMAPYITRLRLRSYQDKLASVNAPNCGRGNNDLNPYIASFVKLKTLVIYEELLPSLLSAHSLC